jgi:hypothetical protein
MSHKNTTPDITKPRMIFNVEDGIAVTSDDAVLAGKHFDKKGTLCMS